MKLQNVFALAILASGLVATCVAEIVGDMKKPSPALVVVESENGQHVWVRPDAQSGEQPTAGLHWEFPGSVYADLRGGSASCRHGYPDVAVIAQDGKPPILQVTSPDGEVVRVDLFRAAKALERLSSQE